MTRTPRAIAFVGAAALVASLALPGVASASSDAAVARQTSSRTDATSSVYSSYTSALAATKSIEGTFVVPKLKCGATDMGIDSIIELASDDGATYSDGAVYSSCVGGTPSHTPVFESSVDGQIVIPNTVKNGDKIHVTQTFKKGKISLKMENLTQKWSAKQTFGGITPDEASSMYYSMLSGGVPLEPLDTGETVTGVKIAGKDLSKTKPTKVTLVDDASKPLVQPSKITKGTDFKFNYVG